MGSFRGHNSKPVPIAGRSRLSFVAALLLVSLVLVRPGLAMAQLGSDRYAGMVIEAETGRVLSAMNPDEPRYPASLTKLMTLYMLFEALRDRRVSLDTPVPVSAHAASMEPSKLGLTPATRLTVEQGIYGLVTKSANDAASALGELLAGGNEARFGQMMTLRARALGMAHTTFRNASGLPNSEQVTTARDMATLARHLVQDFPDEYRYFSTPSFVFHGQTIFNHDRMLQTYPGADGMKTGYTEAAGHNLVTSAMRGGVRLIGVVLGAGSNAQRDIRMRAQLDDGFERMDVPEIREAAAPARLALIPRAEAATIVRPVSHVGEPQGSANWAVQLGTFTTETAARRAGASARIGGELRLEAVTQRRRTLWRAQMIGLRRADAMSACSVRIHHRAPCAVLAPAQVASR
jgi:D-alanyl-D-alanine carboxypeptidase